VGDTAYKDEALRVLRNLLPHVGEAWRSYPDETYDLWAAGLRYADELFGQYEGLKAQAEETDTLYLSSAVKDLLKYLESLRDLASCVVGAAGEGEEFSLDASREPVGPNRATLLEATDALNKAGETTPEGAQWSPLRLAFAAFQGGLEEVKEELAKFD
jgi:hypothetical protein